MLTEHREKGSSAAHKVRSPLVEWAAFLSNVEADKRFPG